MIFDIINTSLVSICLLISIIGIRNLYALKRYTKKLKKDMNMIEDALECEICDVNSRFDEVSSLVDRIALNPAKVRRDILNDRRAPKENNDND